MESNASFKDIVAAIGKTPDKQGEIEITLTNGVVIKVEVRILSLRLHDVAEHYNTPVGTYS